MELFHSYRHICGETPPDRLRELVQADREGRCVIYQPGYSVIRTYNPKDEDSLYTMEACGVVSEKEYKDALKGE